ncbi:DNA-directed RNA polymerase specialized sigma subunit, sigma24 family [Microlunatus sagamiharensis]|uniref:DNA-directed RNA polymerase specialized sigma subunit, sigma24 family n=1 Tax=Microlunatus sagamiharensis TaxID=546874 RepID=A0A1H2N5W1_9ACTN|nr:hypothetical protein [Microlunatus sagamiharensis]SDV00919.1 DNA-directed RNA polymerase specialized sigma subunit, sigma24 family [Microlunatus sagamiharensis]
MLQRLDREWRELEDDEGARSACRRWSARVEALAGCSRPGDVLARVPEDPDAVLLALLEEAVAGDGLAARVVLQAFLPKLVRMAGLDRAAEVDDYVTALWCEVVAYPVGRRRTSVAANLVLDTLKAVHRDRRPGCDVAVPPDLVVVAAERGPGHLVGSEPPGPGGPSADAVLRVAREHHLVDPGTRELLHSVYAEGLSGAAAARLHGLSPGAVRSRCSRAVRVLARHPALLADAR